MLETLRRTGRLFIALSMIGYGVLHLSYKKFITAGPPIWPNGVPGEILWAYSTGVLFLIFGVYTLLSSKSRLVLLAFSLIIGCWATIRIVPILFITPLFSNVWTAFGLSLAICGGSLALAATQPRIESNANHFAQIIVNLNIPYVLAGQFGLGVFLVICGCQHIIYLDQISLLIPNWFPGEAEFWTGFSGVALIAGGAGIQLPRTSQIASILSGFLIFSFLLIVEAPSKIQGMGSETGLLDALITTGIAFTLGGQQSK